MKQSYTVLFFVLSLAWCNASAHGISSRLSGKPRVSLKAPDTKVNRQQTQSITLLQPFMTSLTEVSETFDRIAESNEYVSTPTVEKTLEVTTTFTFNADNWITEQLKTYINIIPGSDVTSPKELKYAPTYEALPGNCLLQTNIYYERPAFQENAPWTETSRNTAKFDSKRRQLESVNPISKTVVTYNDTDNSEEAIFYIKETNEPESSFRPNARIIREKFNVNVGVNLRQTNFTYENSTWQKTQMLESEMTEEGHILTAQYQWSNNTWTGISKTGRETDDEGRLTYDAQFNWNPDAGSWECERESAYIYDANGLLSQETEYDEKSIYSDYFQLLPGELTPAKQTVYVREGYGKEWILSKESIFTINAHNHPTDIKIYTLRNNVLTLTTRSQFEQQTPEQYTLILSQLSDDNTLWMEVAKNVITLNAAQQITQVITYNNRTGITPTWEENERTTYEYVSPTEMIETGQEIDEEEGETYYYRIRYILYPTGEVQSKTYYGSNTGEEGSWTTQQTETYQKDGTLDGYLFDKAQFLEQIAMCQNLSSWKVPAEVTQVKSSQPFLDMNGDGIFNISDYEGTYISFIKGSEEMLVFAYDNKMNAARQSTYSIQFEHPDLTNRYIKNERTTTYNASGGILLEVITTSSAPNMDITRYRENRYDKVPTGINNAPAEKVPEGMQVYGTDKLYINAANSMHIGIFTTDGKQLKTLKVTEGNNEIVLPKGFYIVRPLDNNKLKSAKVIIR